MQTPYMNRNSHVQNGGSTTNYGRGGSAPKELIHNPAEMQMPSSYNNQMPENVQALNNQIVGMNIAQNSGRISLPNQYNNVVNVAQ